MYICPYFPKSVESFAVLGKGQSLLELEKYHNEFRHCFLVNNFDEEIPIIGSHLRDNQCVHFVNKLKTAVMRREHYRDLDIRHVQYCVSKVWGDRTLLGPALRYRINGLKTHKLPKQLLRHNKNFGKGYELKAPNTGLLALWYALEIIQPKILWVIGIDFYEADYVVRRPWANPIEVQRDKMSRLDIPGEVGRAFSCHPGIAINMVTKYSQFQSAKNVRLL